jgi:hypothetical protein
MAYLGIASIKGEKEDRLRYYTALEKSHTENKPAEFLLLTANAEKEALLRYLSILK